MIVFSPSDMDCNSGYSHATLRLSRISSHYRRTKDGVRLCADIYGLWPHRLYTVRVFKTQIQIFSSDQCKTGKIARL